MTKDKLQIACGNHCEVTMEADAKKVFDQATAKDRARAHRICQQLGEYGPSDLTSEQFNFEGRHPGGGKSGKRYAVHAVKSYNLRMYGGWVGGQHFHVMECAIKKKNKADQKQLERVAKGIGALNGD